jgi:hypothetical protein
MPTGTRAALSGRGRDANSTLSLEQMANDPFHNFNIYMRAIEVGG